MIPEKLKSCIVECTQKKHTWHILEKVLTVVLHRCFPCTWIQMCGFNKILFHNFLSSQEASTKWFILCHYETFEAQLTCAFYWCSSGWTPAAHVLTRPRGLTGEHSQGWAVWLALAPGVGEASSGRGRRHPEPWKVGGVGEPMVGLCSLAGCWSGKQTEVITISS